MRRVVLPIIVLPFIISLILSVLLTSGCARRGVKHIVQPGQTLYRIGKTYHVSVDKIIAYNHIKDPSKIKPGQKLFIPGVIHTKTVAVVPGKKKKATSYAKRSVKRTKPPARKTKKSTNKYVPIKKNMRNSTNMRGQFVWPVHGRIVKKFNLSGSTPSKGIDIAVAVGSTVVSAAAGKVIYSGNGISGFGHVIIIEHDNSLYSVYGYNKRLLSSSGSYVSAGQKIAIVGTHHSSGNGRFHFEVWKNKKAVNPAFYLRKK